MAVRGQKEAALGEAGGGLGWVGISNVGEPSARWRQQGAVPRRWAGHGDLTAAGSGAVPQACDTQGT